MLYCLGIFAIFGLLTARSEGITHSKMLKNLQLPTSEYEDLLMNILKNDFRKSKLNFVVISEDCTTCSKILSILMEDSRQPFLTVNESCPTNTYPDTRDVNSSIIHGFVILMVNDSEELFQNFESLRQLYSWNPRAKHLILTFVEPTERELQLFFEECWTYRVLNVGVTIYNTENAYTYNRYLSNRSYDKVNVSNLFEDKLRDMMGHPVRIKYVPFISKNVPRWIPEEKRFQFCGIDWGYGQAFISSVNATPEYLNLSNEDITRLSNYSVRFAYWRQHVFGDSEIWFNSMISNFKFNERSEQLNPIGPTGIYLAVPKSDLMLPNMLQPYNRVSWIFIGASLVACTTYTRILYKCRKIPGDAFISTFAMFFGQFYPKRNIKSMEKCFFFLWSIFSLLVLSTYQGALYSALAKVTYNPEIDTIYELFRRTNKIYTYDNLDSVIREHVPENVEVIPLGTENFINYMKVHRDSCYAFTWTTAEFTVRRKLYSDNGVPYYHLMKECLTRMHSTFFVPYGSPYLDKLNRVTIACREAGLDQYWDAEVNLHALLTGDAIVSEDPSKVLKKLSLRTQVIAFYIWATGLLAAFCCCGYEVYCNRATKKTKKADL